MLLGAVNKKVVYHSQGFHQLQTIQGTNQSSMQIHVHVARKRGKMHKQVLMGFGFTSDWLRRQCKYLTNQ